MKQDSYKGTKLVRLHREEVSRRVISQRQRVESGYQELGVGDSGSWYLMEQIQLGNEKALEVDGGDAYMTM